MTDIRERLRDRAITRHTLDHGEEGAKKACRVMAADHKTMNEAADTIDKLVEALEECELELNAYYEAAYGGPHPYSVKKLADEKSNNPATIALKAVRGE